jgi:HAD superfamily hydrolase (TIGR01509 family)
MPTGRGTVLRTVIFDVDGTLVDSERDGHRVAFNQAFAEFDLPYRWDEPTYGRLLDVTGGQPRLHAYLAGEGVAGAERDELVPRLHARKTELFLALAAAGEVPARPGALRLLDELGDLGVTVGVATTGSRMWVEPLLDRHFGLDRFAVIVTGDDTSQRKPDPESYVVALRALGAGTGSTVAVEDSDNGVRAARAAGLRVAAVANDYTATQELQEAAVVLDGFGMPGVPVKVRHDPDGVLEAGILDAAALARIAANPF